MSVVEACSSIPQNRDNKFQRTQFWSRFSRKTPLNSLDLINGFRCFDDPWNQKFEDPLLQRSSPWLQRTTYSPAGRWTRRWIKIGQDFVCLLGLGVDYTSGCQSKLSCGKSGVSYSCHLIHFLAVLSGLLNHFPGQPCQPAPSSEKPRRCHHAPSNASNAQFLTWIPFFMATSRPLGCPNCHIAFLHLVCQEDQQPNKDQQWHAPRDEELPKPTKCRLSAFMAFALTKWQVKDLKRIWKTAATGPRNVK